LPAILRRNRAENLLLPLWIRGRALATARDHRMTNPTGAVCFS